MAPLGRAAYSIIINSPDDPWTFECIHHLVHPDHSHTDCYDYLELFFRLMGCLNLLRGSLIFFIFVCKDSILDKVLQKHNGGFSP